MTVGPRTLAVDCGGTGIKAVVLDAGAEMLSERIRVPTPYPCPPDTLLATIAGLARELDSRVAYDRVSVGVPGLVRRGIVHATPHYVTESGPFSPRLPELVTLWSGFDVERALTATLRHPTRVVNDAEVQGMAVIARSGYEVVLTLGTGLGFAQFLDGVLLPKLELSQHPWRKGQTYDQQLGHHQRRRLGNARWSQRVANAVATLRPVLWWDRLYLGGGGARHIAADVVASLGPLVQIVPNTSGLLGGVRLWDLPDGP